MILSSSPSPANRRLRLALVALALLLQWTAVPLHLATHGHLGHPEWGSHGPHAHARGHEAADARRGHGHDHGPDGTAGAGAREEGDQPQGHEPQGNEPQGHEPHALEDHLLSLAESGSGALQPLLLCLVLGCAEGPSKRLSEAWGPPVLEDDPRPPPELGRRPARAPPRLA